MKNVEEPRFEPLEERHMLSASPVAMTGAALVVNATTVTGVLVHPIAGELFSGVVGIIHGFVPPPGPLVVASIDWGDGTAPSAGNITFDSHDDLQVHGHHTYSAVGNFAITVQVNVVPPPPLPGFLEPDYILHVGTIHSVADVTQNSQSGITFTPTAGQQFSGIVGSTAFPTNLPEGWGLQAIINWGDGTTSDGMFPPSVGRPLPILGTHTYKKSGQFRVTITVLEVPPLLTLPPVKVLDVIYSTADVRLRL